MTVWYDTTAVFGDGDVVLRTVVVTVVLCQSGDGTGEVPSQGWTMHHPCVRRWGVILAAFPMGGHDLLGLPGTRQLSETGSNGTSCPRSCWENVPQTYTPPPPPPCIWPTAPSSVYFMQREPGSVHGGNMFPILQCPVAVLLANSSLTLKLLSKLHRLSNSTMTELSESSPVPDPTVVDPSSAVRNGRCTAALEPGAARRDSDACAVERDQEMKITDSVEGQGSAVIVLLTGLLESSMRLKPHEAQSYRKKALWVSWISIVVTLILAVAAFIHNWYQTPCGPSTSTSNSWNWIGHVLDKVLDVATSVYRHSHIRELSCVVQPSDDGAALTGGLMEDTTARWRSVMVAVGSVRQTDNGKPLSPAVCHWNFINAPVMPGKEPGEDLRLSAAVSFMRHSASAFGFAFDATLDVLSSIIVLWRYSNAAAVHSAHREYIAEFVRYLGLDKASRRSSSFILGPVEARGALSDRDGLIVLADVSEREINGDALEEKAMLGSIPGVSCGQPSWAVSLGQAFCEQCPVGSFLRELSCAVSFGQHPESKDCGQHPEVSILRATFLRQHPVGSVLWTVSLGQRSVSSVLWAAIMGSVLRAPFCKQAAFCEQCPVGRVLRVAVMSGVLWAVSLGQCSVSSVPWAASCGHCPVGSVFKAAFCEQCPVGSVMRATIMGSVPSAVSL
ncbi:hypothetical protein NFI96_025560 [Prochilodus magdalenae]|nr:hypothetical protein NFI96_025560 [Prochilodus magdalenae]